MTRALGWATSLAAGFVFAGASLCGCTVAADDGGDDSAAVDDAVLAECDRSPYNCKLPAAHKDRNRIFNYATNSYDWPISANTALLDGLGNERGHVAESSVRINYGLRKHLHGVNHVYAFAAKLDTKLMASGWIKESAVKDGPITRMKTVALTDPGHGDYETVWTVTGGNNAEYEGLKVVKDWSDGGCNATDYLVRPGGFFNLLYNLPGSGGVAIDTFPLGVTFRRAKGVNQLDINLYNPGGTHVVDKMYFVYGHVGGRYGWVAKAALTAASDPGGGSGGGSGGSSGGGAAGSGGDPTPPPPADPTGQCYVRCCDGSLQGPIATTSASACHDASQGACEAKGHVKRSEFNGAQVWERPNACWAKCFNRAAYHEVTGVTQDCTQHAKEYCAVSDRGGLQDAAWSQCQP